MIILNCEQGSDEWFVARLGIPGASNFGKILTATGKASTQDVAYRHKLLVEWIVGETEESFKSDWMERGNEVEEEARGFYAMLQDVEVQQVGLVYKGDDKTIECSPDGLVGEDGGLELKVPAPHTHVGYLLDNKLPTKYIPQVQGNMWVTGRLWWDFMSYSPSMEPLIIRVDRDDAYILRLAAAISRFVEKMLEEQETLKARGIVPAVAA